MPKFDLKLFKILFLDFKYIHSKSWKLSTTCMFILYQKRQFIYPKKANSPPIKFPFFQIFRHTTCHMSIINC